MPQPYAELLATIATGRTALVERHRTIAASIKETPLESVAEVLGLLESAVAVCEQRSALAFERAPAARYALRLRAHCSSRRAPHARHSRW